MDETKPDRTRERGAGRTDGTRVGVSRIEGESPLQPSDLELWNRLRRGPDREGALGALYDRHASLVFGLSARILGDRQMAEDLTQEVFLGLFEGQGFDESRGSLRTYLSLVTRSRSIDRLRRRRRDRATSDPIRLELVDLGGDETSPLERLTVEADSRVVSEALSKLSERQRHAIELAYYRGLTQTEIASELGEPLGTVKALLRASLQALRRALGHGRG